MFDWSIIELGIVLLVSYLALGLVTSYLNDMISGLMQWRSQDAAAGIRKMLEGSDLADRLLQHPLMQHLTDKAGRLPRYTPPEVFIQALFSLSSPPGQVSTSLAEFQDFVKRMPDSAAKYTLQGFLDNNPTDRTAVERAIGEWFLREMRYTAASYARRIQWVSLLVAIALTALLGFDTFAVAGYFLGKSGINAALAAAASTNGTNPDVVRALVEKSLPIGWEILPQTTTDWIRKLVGLGISALAVALCAPFSYSVRQYLLPRLFFPGTNVAISLQRLREAKPGEVQEIAASQILLLNEYQNQVLSQQNRSFAYALVAAVIGLCFFILAVGIGVVQQTTNAALVSALAGGIVEVISGINFYLYAKTSEQVALFHSRLDLTQRFLLANSVCETLDGQYKQEARSALVHEIAAGNSTSPDGAAPRTDKPVEAGAGKNKSGG